MATAMVGLGVALADMVCLCGEGMVFKVRRVRGWLREVAVREGGEAMRFVWVVCAGLEWGGGATS